ncbi:response regulator [bacterium]|nr:response regulator [bacterium]
MTDGPEGRPVVLVAQAQDLCRKLLAIQLTRWGIDFELVEDGRAALSRFTRYSYHLVLIDVWMPIMDGLTAARCMRVFEEEHSDRITPIIAITADAFPETAERCRKAGICEVLTKPYHREELRKIVSHYLDPSVES